MFASCRRGSSFACACQVPQTLPSLQTIRYTGRDLIEVFCPASVGDRLVLYCRYFTWVRGRSVYGQTHAGISPCCLRATPQSTAHLFLCQRQQIVRGEWYLRPPCDAPRWCHHPPLWSPDIQASDTGICMLLLEGACKNRIPRLFGCFIKLHTSLW